MVAKFARNHGRVRPDCDRFDGHHWSARAAEPLEIVKEILLAALATFPEAREALCLVFLEFECPSPTW
jgi:hypothetical protein